MLRGLDSDTQRAIRVAGIASAVLLAVFVAAAGHMRHRVLDLVHLYEEAARRAAERQLRIHAWHLPDENERRLWDDVNIRWREAVPDNDIRLAASDELTGLAARCGLERVSLSEIGAIELGNAYYDAFEDLDVASLNRYTGGPGEPDSVDVPWVADEGVRTEVFGYRMRFNSDYASLLEFLDGLEYASGMIVLRQAVIRRSPPSLDVILTLAAHRRQA